MKKLNNVVKTPFKFNNGSECYISNDVYSKLDEKYKNNLLELFATRNKDLGVRAIELIQVAEVTGLRSSLYYTDYEQSFSNHRSGYYIREYRLTNLLGASLEFLALHYNPNGTAGYTMILDDVEKLEKFVLLGIPNKFKKKLRSIFKDTCNWDMSDFTECGHYFISVTQKKEVKSLIKWQKEVLNTVLAILVFNKRVGNNVHLNIRDDRASSLNVYDTYSEIYIQSLVSTCVEGCTYKNYDKLWLYSAYKFYKMYKSTVKANKKGYRRLYKNCSVPEELQ